MEFLLALVGAFLGALGAFASDYVFRTREAINVEQAAVNNLLFELEEKRALTPDHTSSWPPQAGENIIASVLDVKELLRITRRSLRPRTSFLEPLQKMTKACNTFLESTEHKETGPTGSDVMDLAQSLRGQAIALRRASRGKIVAAAPGNVTYEREIDRGVS